MTDGDPAGRHGKASELTQVTILALGFGMVGIDRFLISTLFPVIAEDLSLSYSDIGTITGALAIAWGIAALFMGNWADRVGRRKVLTASMLVFSLLVGFSGLATGLFTLVLIRVLMGFADGAYTPASIAATMDASPPQRRGRNIGFQQMTALLFGLGIAPLIIPMVLHWVDWRWVFVLLVPPGLVLTWLTYRLIPQKAPGSGETAHHDGNLSAWRSVARFRNIRIAMALMLIWLTCLVTISAFMPNYMLDHLNLSFAQMSTAMSAIGIGGAVGTMVLPWLSDHIGRKQVMLLGTACALGGVVFLSSIGPSVPLLFGGLFVVMACIMSLITLTVGPLCSESAPAALTGTASGLVIAVGELFGGGVAPVVAGYVAQTAGISHVLWLPMGALVLGLLLCVAIERRPQASAVSA